ncbi:MAG: hypothetical protein PHR56_05015 [Dehalococcoidales bacterium]|nr:hypothetical protein [Dehalococcoidales bacterium]
MGLDEERIAQAASRTEILRPPRQSLATFGVTSINYYLVTEPVYSELEKKDTTETVIREGKVVAQKPQIVTPYYLTRLEGFSGDARKYFEMLLRMHGADAPGVFYTYKNEPSELSIVSDNWITVVNRLNDEIDRRGNPLTSIIKGEDELWDVSLMKFIFELTRYSLRDNLMQMNERGLLKMDSRGLPADARLRIEELFQQVIRGEREPNELQHELERWGVFEEYQDRFYTLFRKKNA